MNVLIVLGHPRILSLCGALAGAFAEGALEAGVKLRQLDLAALAFDPNVRTASPRQQELAEGLVWLLYRRLRSGKPPSRLDGLMAASLTFLLWLGLIPLFQLAG